MSVCTPAYYADILAERGRCYLKSYASERGSEGREWNELEAPWVANVHAK